MDSCISPRTPNSPIALNSPRGLAHASLANAGFPISPGRFNPQSQNKVHESGRHIYARRSSQPLVLAVADTGSRGSKNISVSTPHELSSPEGKLLNSILQNHPHLFQFAVSEQLNELAANKDETSYSMDQSSMESILQRRIAEVKEKERQIAVEDVMYMSIVHEFAEAEVPMVPKLSKCISDNKLDIGPSKHREFASVHSLEVQEMVREHIARILYNNGLAGTMDGESTNKIDRLHLGRIYAASVLYGYFLKSANFRRQFDSGLARAPDGLQSHGDGTYLSFTELYPYQMQTLATLGQPSGMNATSLYQEPLRGSAVSGELSSYVMGFDSESLQRCAKLKSQEAVNVIEKHTWALFGDEKIGQPGGDNDIVVTLPSLERLTMEAVTFGSFLWDVERSVDSVCGLKQNQLHGN